MAVVSVSPIVGSGAGSPITDIANPAGSVESGSTCHAGADPVPRTGLATSVRSARAASMKNLLNVPAVLFTISLLKVSGSNTFIESRATPSIARRGIRRCAGDAQGEQPSVNPMTRNVINLRTGPAPLDLCHGPIAGPLGRNG